MISGAQLRAARGLLDWKQSQLAYAAGLSIPTIKRAERNMGVRVSSSAYRKIESALMQAGVVFLMKDSDGGIGVRLQVIIE
jgi:transcriptional regulator with XRE-family HTH domain